MKIVYTLIKQIGNYTAGISNFENFDAAKKEYLAACEEIKEYGEVSKKALEEYTPLDMWSDCFDRVYSGSVKTTYAKTPIKFMITFTGRKIREN